MECYVTATIRLLTFLLNPAPDFWSCLHPVQPQMPPLTFRSKKRHEPMYTAILDVSPFFEERGGNPEAISESGARKCRDRR